MELEEIKNLLNDESFKTALKDLGYETAEDLTGLKNKRDELLGTNKALKEKVKDYESKLSQIDFEEYAELKNNSEKSKGNQQEREFKKLQEQLAKMSQEREALENQINKAIIKDSLIEGFKKANIDPKHYDLLTSAYIGKAKIEVDGEKRSAIIDDGNLGLPPQEYFVNWASTEIGKEYVAKPVNAGTGANRFSNLQSQSVFTREQLRTPEGRKAYLENKNAEIKN